MEDALLDAVGRRAVPFLGFCVGMQMLATVGREYEDVPGFDLIGGAIERIVPSDPALKVPHMGWNQVSQQDHSLWAGIENNSRFYFVHSFYVKADDQSLVRGHCDYGLSKGDHFDVALAQGNLFAVQFHPEKSHTAGLQLLKNFARWNGLNDKGVQ